MAKKLFVAPFVLLEGDLPVQSPDVTAAASAHGHIGTNAQGQDVSVWPMPYGKWLELVADDCVAPFNGPDWYDYEQWYKDNGLNTSLMSPNPNPGSDSVPDPEP